MAKKSMLGTKARRLRRQHGLTQVDLAERLSISPSYLNLIEHNRRPLTLPLLIKLAENFGIDVREFSEDEEARLSAGLGEVFSDPLFHGESLSRKDLNELVSLSPGLCRAVLTLYRAFRQAHDDLAAFSDRLSGDAFLMTSTHELRTLLTSIRSFSEILLDERDMAPEERRRFLRIVAEESARLTDLAGEVLELTGGGEAAGDAPRAFAEEATEFLQATGNHFPEIEAAAETLWEEAALAPGELFAGLKARLGERHAIVVEIEPFEDGAAPDWSYDPARRRLRLSEALPPESRTFRLARHLGELENDELLDTLVPGERFGDAASRAACRALLAKYLAGAVMMPYVPFHRSARAFRYDLDLLRHRFGASFEQVAHRLTTLGRPAAKGIPFHFLRVDIAGNISKRYSGSGFRIPLHGGACPRWNVHTAFMAPGKTLVQLARMPDGAAFFCVARAVLEPSGGHRVPDNYLAIGLGCEAGRARDMVYADGIDLDDLEAAVPVGVSCRVCERADCHQRAFPPLLHRLDAAPEKRANSADAAP